MFNGKDIDHLTFIMAVAAKSSVVKKKVQL